MGERGPKPLPQNVHLLRGNAGHKPMAALLDDCVRPAVDIPECPDDLDGEARAEWDRITPHLQKLGLISQIDLAALTAYCDTFGEYTAVRKVIRALRDRAPATGDTMPDSVERWFVSHVAKTPSGYQQISIPIQHRNRLLEQLKSFLSMFGMSPSDRSRVTQSDAPQMGLPGMDEPKVGGWGNFK